MKIWRRKKRPAFVVPKVRIENIDAEGFTLHVDEETFRVSFDDYPMLRGVPAETLQHFEVLLDEGIWWDDLDEGIEFDALRYPERYPLLMWAPEKRKAAKAKA